MNADLRGLDVSGGATDTPPPSPPTALKTPVVRLSIIINPNSTQTKFIS